MTLKPDAELIKVLPWIREQGYDPFAIYAQCYLETGNFTSDKCTVNNLAGMYPRKDSPYPSKNFPTFEYVVENGKQVKKPVDQAFVAYPTVLDFLKDYDLMVRKKFAKEAYPVRHDYQRYFRGLMHIGLTEKDLRVILYPSFCTNVDYSENLITTYDYLKKRGDLYQIISGSVWPNS